MSDNHKGGEFTMGSDSFAPGDLKIYNRPPKKTPKETRKTISISVDASGHLFALCDDGSIWERKWIMPDDALEWFQVESIPQDTP